MKSAARSRRRKSRVEYEPTAIPDAIRDRRVAYLFLAGSFAAFAWPTISTDRTLYRESGPQDILQLEFFREPVIGVGIVFLLAGVVVWYLSSGSGSKPKR